MVIILFFIRNKLFPKEFTMHERKLLHKLLEGSSAISHIKRQESLVSCVESILNGANLTVTEIGRKAPGAAYVKHKIKQSDRLAGNEHLIKEREAIYQATLKYLVRPLMTMLVDWSEVEHHGCHTLRASLSLKDRSITVYEELHEEKFLGNSDIQKRFLHRLKAMLPEEPQVILIADAGFKTDFFQAVLELNWDFIVRVRSNMLFRADGSNAWVACPDFYATATSTAMYLGEGELSKSTKTLAHLYLYQGDKPDKGKKKRRRRKNTAQEHAYRKRHNQPWLIASSLKKPAGWIVKQYKKRMKIEHEFRDMKDRNWGLGLRHSKSRGIVRLSNLLLIAHLACFLLWCIGLWGEQYAWHRRFQSNSQSSRRVLSVIFLGSLIMQSPEFRKSSRSVFREIAEIIEIQMKGTYREKV